MKPRCAESLSVALPNEWAAIRKAFCRLARLISRLCCGLPSLQSRWGCRSFSSDNMPRIRTWDCRCLQTDRPASVRSVDLRRCFTRQMVGCHRARLRHAVCHNGLRQKLIDADLADADAIVAQTAPTAKLESFGALSSVGVASHRTKAYRRRAVSSANLARSAHKDTADSARRADGVSRLGQNRGFAERACGQADKAGRYLTCTRPAGRRGPDSTTFIVPSATR